MNASDSDTFQILNPMPKIKLKNSLVGFVGQNIIVKKVVDYVRENFTNFDELKFDLEFLEHALRIVKNIIPKNKTLEVDKIIIIEKVFQELFASITTDELVIIKSHVEYFFKNKIVRRIPLSKKILNLVYKLAITL